jgi:hypothetical protein
MSYFYEEIFNGLDEIPVSGAPGILVVNGEKAQAVCTGENQVDVFLAAAEYGDGRVFVSSHDAYLHWFRTKATGLEGDFINRIIRWLTKGSNADNLNTIEASKLNDESDLSQYKMIILSYERFNEKLNENLRAFVDDGGALFCSLTPWAFSNDLNNFLAFSFLRDYCEILITDKYFCPPTRIPVTKNMARFSNFRDAIKAVCRNSKELNNFNETINFCMDSLSKYDISCDHEVSKMKRSLLKQCKENNLQIIPNLKNPIKLDEAKKLTKLFCKCSIALGEKVQNIDEFPFDFKEEPVLKTNITLKLSSKFNERLSTGYYLPAGVQMTVNVIQGSSNGWTCKIGAHTDILHDTSEYTRWPVCFVEKNMSQRKSLKIKSPFGGLIYFDW